MVPDGLMIPIDDVVNGGNRCTYQIELTEIFTNKNIDFENKFSLCEIRKGNQKRLDKQRQKRLNQGIDVFSNSLSR